VNDGREEVVEKHREALAREIKRKEDLALEELRIQRETEERKRQRAEMRVIRAAW
jgi:hypothetical protein